MPEPAGAVNVYRCAACGHETVTINRDAGTTPFIIPCPSCGGRAVSQFYRVDQSLTPEWEWYRPVGTRRLSRSMQEHVSLGGLLLRKIDREQGSDSMRLWRVFGRDVWWRSKNLNEEARRLAHGRGWLRWGDIDTGIDGGIEVEWIVGRPLFLLGGSVVLSHGHDDPVAASLYCWPFSLYLSVNSKLAKTIARRFAPRQERKVALSVRRTGEISWSVWVPEYYWSPAIPRYRCGQWNPVDAILGGWDRRIETVETARVEIPMPEKAYPATVTLQRVIHWRRRLPWMRRVVHRAHVEIPGGIGKPGKGENAWDIGDDATYAMTASATSVEEAIGKVVASILSDRMQYGGSHTFTPAKGGAS